MNGLSVIIPSRNADNLSVSLAAVLFRELPHVRVIVVDDGLSGFPGACGLDPQVILVDGVKPFVFARNVNLGIAAAGSDDVVLLNDDAVLETVEGFSHMQRFAEEHPDVGILSASTNLAGNPEQMRRAIGGVRYLGNTPGNSFPTVAFVCVLIPRRTFDAVAQLDLQLPKPLGGPLDEIFTAYGWEDNDFCRRVHLAGLKIAVSDTCYVDHSRLHSTFRGNAYAGGSIDEGRKIYLNKWGTI